MDDLDDTGEQIYSDSQSEIPSTHHNPLKNFLSNFPNPQVKRFLFSGITSLILMTGLITGIYLIKNNQDIKIQAQTCNSYNLVSGSISPDPTYPGGNVTVKCNYGANIDCIAPSSQSNLQGCSIVSFKNNEATFSCKAPSSPGTYNFYCSLFSGTAFNCCSQNNYVENYSVNPLNPPELSYWLHLDVSNNNNDRGYWYDYRDKPENPIPTFNQINNALNALVYKYYANRIYLVYHRQYEIDNAKTVFNYWKQANQNIPSNYRPVLVPTFVAINYGPESTNFTTSELSSFAQWLKSNFNNQYIAFYDVYSAIGNRDLSPYISAVNSLFPNGLIRVGLQPHENLPSAFDGAVEDTWTAEAAGSSNNYWEFPPDECGLVGKPLLEDWVGRRVNDNRKFAFDLIVVAWDYDVPPHPICNHLLSPGDIGTLNDPVPPGRPNLSHHAIAGVYNRNNALQRFGGFSSDLVILNSTTRVQEGYSQSLYAKLTQNNKYTGRFASALNDVAAVYKKYNNVPSPSPTTIPPTPTPTPTQTPTPTNTPTPPDIPGDADGDGRVDRVDYNIWQNHYSQSTSHGPTDGDFNQSGKVEGRDFIIWLNNYTE